VNDATTILDYSPRKIRRPRTRRERIGNSMARLSWALVIVLIVATLLLEYFWPHKPWYSQAPFIVSVSDQLPLLAQFGIVFGIAGTLCVNTWALIALQLHILWFMLVPSHGFS
jgi:H+/Cl- antiporter ClcA